MALEDETHCLLSLDTGSSIWALMTDLMEMVGDKLATFTCQAFLKLSCTVIIKFSYFTVLFDRKSDS